MSVELWTTRVKELTTKAADLQNALLLSELFNLDISNPQISSLQNDILDNDNKDFEQKIDHTNFYEGDWPGFVELTKSYLRFTRDVDPNDVVGSFDLYAQFLTDLQAAFSNMRGAVLVDTVVRSCRIIVGLSLTLDAMDSPLQMMRSSYISSLLLKIFNTIRAEKIDPLIAGPNPVTKKTAILYIASMLCRLYFKMAQPGSCANVFSNIHTANIKFGVYTRAQRVEYRYWLGRFYLYKCQLTNAYRHLNWSFRNCLASSRNKRTILMYLIAPAMLLGKLPSRELLELYNLEHIYWPLVVALRGARYSAFMAHLENTDWFYKNSLLVLLRSRSIIVLHRMALYKLWRISTSGSDKPVSTVAFNHFETAVKLSGALIAANDDQEIENIGVSLISQGYVKANIFTRNKVLRLKPVDPIPRMVSIHRIGQGDPEELTGTEIWMAERN
jgi:hypothetical protein